MGTMGIGLAQGDAGLFEASRGQGAAGGSGPALQSGIWVLPYGVFSSRTFPEVPKKTRHPGRHCPRGAHCQLADTSEGRQSPGGGRRHAQPTGQAAPAHPSGLGVCSASRRGCVWLRARVSVVGGGGPPSCSIRPFY